MENNKYTETSNLSWELDKKLLVTQTQVITQINSVILRDLMVVLYSKGILTRSELEDLTNTGCDRIAKVYSDEFEKHDQSDSVMEQSFEIINETIETKREGNLKFFAENLD